MFPFLSCLLILCRLSSSVALKDLETAAITVYRNPDFFRHLSDEFNNHVHQFSQDPYHYGPKDNYESPVDSNGFYNHLNEKFESTFPDERGRQEQDEREVQDEEHQEEENDNYSDVPENHRENYREEEAEDEPEKEYQKEEETEGDSGYKYPGEPKKPNPSSRPSVNVHFDGSPDFGHPGRNLPAPNKPKKNGRGPYGHPQFQENDNPRYSEEYEEDRSKSEEQQLEEVEDESRRHNEENGLPPPQRYYNEYSKTYPNNNEKVEDESRRKNEKNEFPPPQRYYNEYPKTYPNNNEKVEDESRRHNEKNKFPPPPQRYYNEYSKTYPNNNEEVEDESRRHNEENGLHPPQKYYNEYSNTYSKNNEEPKKGNGHLPLKIYHQGQRYPAQPEEYDGYENIQYPLKTKRGRDEPSEEVRDTKKGTREYLRHATLPSYHELHDLEPQKQQKPKRVATVSCDTRIKPKPKKKNMYVAYKIRPAYNYYRVPSSAPKKIRKMYYVHPGQGHYRRRSAAAPTSKLVADDSAYVINSELDQDYQRLQIVRTKKPQ